MKLKFLFIPFMTVFVLGSCESDNSDVYNQNDKSLTSQESNLKSKSPVIPLKGSTHDFNLIINSGSPLNIESEFLEVASANIYENGELVLEGGEILIPKEDYRVPMSSGGGGRIYEGWYWDDSHPYYDRFIYGTWYEDGMTGEKLFVPASIDTQFLFNWSSPWGTKYA